MSKKNDQLNFEIGTILSSKHVVMDRLGGGYEGEVYLVKEIGTGIERAAKFFYQKKGTSERWVRLYAKKLHKLGNCNSLVRYISKEKLKYKGKEYTYVLSEYVEGELLSTYISYQKGKALPWYKALHLFYSILRAVEEIHIQKSYHGDLHSDNIILQFCGLEYDVKLIDVFHLSNPKSGSIQQDVYFLCDILYELIGGQPKYSKTVPIIKNICCGRRAPLIKKKFQNATQMRVFLENEEWEPIQ